MARPSKLDSLERQIEQLVPTRRCLKCGNEDRVKVAYLPIDPKRPGSDDIRCCQQCGMWLVYHLVDQSIVDQSIQHYTDMLAKMGKECPT